MISASVISNLPQLTDHINLNRRYFVSKKGWRKFAFVILNTKKDKGPGQWTRNGHVFLPVDTLSGQAMSVSTLPAGCSSINGGTGRNLLDLWFKWSIP